MHKHALTLKKTRRVIQRIIRNVNVLIFVKTEILERRTVGAKKKVMKKKEKYLKTGKGVDHGFEI